MSTLPRRLWRVTWKAAVGWPEPERRQETARNFASERAAGAQLAIIDNMPTHLEVVSVHTCECTWTELDPDTIPRPERHDDDDE